MEGRKIDSSTVPHLNWRCPSNNAAADKTNGAPASVASPKPSPAGQNTRGRFSVHGRCELVKQQRWSVKMEIADEPKISMGGKTKYMNEQMLEA